MPARLASGACLSTERRWRAWQSESILLRADELLYRSKREGRNRVTA
jgi:PleD family two-component response regulator